MYSPASGGEIMLQEFVEQVEKTARSVMEEMHTAIPGKITAFNAGIRLCYCKTLWNIYN